MTTIELVDEIHDEPRTRAVYRVFRSYQLGHERSKASAHNSAAALLIEEELIAEGLEPDPNITVENAIRSSLKIHEHEGIKIKPRMIEEAVRAWKETPRCVPSSPSSSSR